MSTSESAQHNTSLGSNLNKFRLNFGTKLQKLHSTSDKIFNKLELSLQTLDLYFKFLFSN